MWSPYPPPDALAFYLPFHYFHPVWWGVYLLLEGVQRLATFIEDEASGELTYRESFVVARVYLYSHEAFHHNVEAFATRLEVGHRQPLYRKGFEKRYQATAGTDDWLEEALACTYAFRKVRNKLFPGEERKKEAALAALENYLNGCPPGYRQAMRWVPFFDFQREKLAEEYFRAALPALKPLRATVWGNFSHAFHGFSRVNSRTNYVVHRGSPLSQRLRLADRFVRYRDLAKRLRRLAKCEETGTGRGSHVKWRNPDGRTFPVPRHPRELSPDTLRKIIKQAGLSLSISEFLQTKP